MHTTNLRKVGGSVMLAVPPALLDLLRIGAGATRDPARLSDPLRPGAHPRSRCPQRATP